jgi:uncharacterized protein (TIGR00730 family)
MTELRTICVYCGSGPGQNPAYITAAEALGRICAQQNIKIIYGGANIGIMGAVAQSCIDAGGYVTGILPEFWENSDEKHTGLSELIITKTMHERKQMMYELSDGFVAMPGGVGTLEELIEMMTWGQLGHHAKPIVLGSIDGFWQPLISLLDHMIADEFIRDGMMISYEVAERAEDILPKLRMQNSADQTT